MKRLLASYRWRRRLIWLTVTAAIVGCLTAIALLVPNKHSKVQGPSDVTITLEQGPTPVRLKRRDEALAIAAGSRFLHTAVARKNVDRSWDLVSAEFRAGFTRKQWDKGDLPVVPYPVGLIRNRRARRAML